MLTILRCVDEPEHGNSALWILEEPKQVSFSLHVVKTLPPSLGIKLRQLAESPSRLNNEFSMNFRASSHGPNGEEIAPSPILTEGQYRNQGLIMQAAKLPLRYGPKQQSQ